jgi:hypothetical protein
MVRGDGPPDGRHRVKVPRLKALQPDG